MDGRWVTSPQDLVSELECHQRVALSAAVKQGLVNAPQSDNRMLQLLQRRGQRHETARLLEVGDLRVFELPKLKRWIANELAAAWQVNESAMLQEFDVIYPATLYTGDFLGLADFLMISRDENGNLRRGEHGWLVYEPVDAKSAMSAKRVAALQVGAYAEILTRLGWPQPIKVHFGLAGESKDWSGPAERFMAVAREVRERLQAKLPPLTGIPSLGRGIGPEARQLWRGIAPGGSGLLPREDVSHAPCSDSTCINAAIRGEAHLSSRHIPAIP